MKKSNMTITPPYKNKAFGLTASILALSSVLGSASVANAATFGFSFDNTSGDTPGTVSGTIELPDAALTVDGGYTASSVVVTSAPTDINLSTPFDFVANALNTLGNTFQVVAGNIVIAGTEFFIQTVPSPTTNYILSFNDSRAGQAADLPGTSNRNVATTSNDPGGLHLTFTAPASASTPEPTSVITLICVGVLGVASKKLKKKA